MTHNTSRPVEAGADTGIADLEAELDTTRHELADTLDELAGRLDVKSRGKAAARSRGVQIRAGIAAAAVIGVILLLIRRKRR